MANNPIFKKVLIKDIELSYPRLDQTYRFNTQEQRSEACNPSAQGSSWNVSWSMSAEDARTLYMELKTHYAACQKIDASLPKFSTVFGMKKLDNSLVSFRAKKSGVSRAGEPNQPPIVIDGAKNALADKAIWTGSKGTVRVIAFPSKSPQTNEGGISLLLDAVQVTEAVYGDASGLDDFDIVAAPEAETDPFGLPVDNPTEAKVNEVLDDLEDSIPF